MTARRQSAPVFVLLAASALGVACKKTESGAPPPESAMAPSTDAARPAGCAAPGHVDDAVSSAYFPATVPGGCLEPGGDTRAYGERAKSSLEELCTTAFDGECEVYRGFGVRRVVGVRYVDSGGKQGTVEVYVSQFASKGGAFGMFTKRVVGDSDPADPQAPQSFGAGESSALGTGRGYVWTGSYLIELTYSNDDGSLTQEAFKAASDALIGPIGKAIAGALPQDTTPVTSVAALPIGSRIPNGVAYFPTDGLGIPHLGPVALGYYRDGELRFRTFAIARTTLDDAKADLRLFKSRPGAHVEQGTGDEAVTVEVQGSAERPGTTYLVVRTGATVIAVGTEPFATDHTLDAAGRKSRVTPLLAALTPTAPRSK